MFCVPTPSSVSKLVSVLDYQKIFKPDYKTWLTLAFLLGHKNTLAFDPRTITRTKENTLSLPNTVKRESLIILLRLKQKTMGKAPECTHTVFHAIFGIVLAQIFPPIKVHINLHHILVFF